MTIGAAGGFTLLELLVVLVILGLLGTLVPRLAQGSSGLQVDTASATLAADLRLLRVEAMRRHATTMIVLDDRGYTLLPGNVFRARLNGVSMSYLPAAVDILGRTPDRLMFFPDGSASGGSIRLQSGHVTSSLHIGWIDGSITAHAR